MGFIDDLLQDFDWGDEKSRLERERQELEAIVARLEDEYKDRGLKFTRPIWGAMPVQANGWIDGMRFYFRFRHDQGELRVGPFNEELEERIFRKTEAIRKKLIAEDYTAWEAGKITGDELRLSLILHRAKPRPTADDPDYVPEDLRFCSVIDHYTGEDWMGVLHPDQAYDIFTKLIDRLEPVAEEARFRPGLLEWLDESD